MYQDENLQQVRLYNNLISTYVSDRRVTTSAEYLICMVYICFGTQRYIYIYYIILEWSVYVSWRRATTLVKYTLFGWVACVPEREYIIISLMFHNICSIVLDRFHYFQFVKNSKHRSAITTPTNIK